MGKKKKGKKLKMAGEEAGGCGGERGFILWKSRPSKGLPVWMVETGGGRYIGRRRGSEM